MLLRARKPTTCSIVCLSLLTSCFPPSEFPPGLTAPLQYLTTHPTRLGKLIAERTRDMLSQSKIFFLSNTSNRPQQCGRERLSLARRCTERRVKGPVEGQLFCCHFRRLMNLAARSSISVCPLELAGGLVSPVSGPFSGGSSCLFQGGSFTVAVLR